MLYESTYNQYFLEHSWGPWKKHLYITRDGESGNYTYKYPKEYYQKYKSDAWKEDRYAGKKADENANYYDSYYNTAVDKVINRSVKAAVNALNFGNDLKNKAEGYLNRFADAVANAWNTAKSPDRTRVQAGKQFVSNVANYVANTVTAKKVSASVRNLIQGASEAIGKSWNSAKTKAENAGTDIKRKLRDTKNSIKNRVNGPQPV